MKTLLKTLYDALGKTLCHALGILAVTGLLASCASQNGQSTTQIASNLINRQNVVITTPPTTTTTEKNPQTVAIYGKEQSPHAAYKVIGVATVSKYNLLGTKRPDDTVQGMMKGLAASIGGDGLIDVSNNADSIQGQVIQFQKIMI
ncbi:MAG TPA: hypothetical protein VHZ76_05555 [Gammaproteobacteria bacterium]|jgi:hypothetical protein|nr:hypothetical protein [Gammaproteobacteria bacterium]